MKEVYRKLRRERRSGRGRGTPPRPHATRSGSRASASASAASHTRDGSPPARSTSSQSPPSSPGWEVTSYKKNRKRSSPTKAQGSPPKQQKMQQRPLLQPKSQGTVQAPSATENQARARARQAIGSSDHIHPFNFLDPNDSKKGFRLQWNINKDSNQGMEHILKRHTYEYHDGSSKPTQSMFPRGTTHRNIVEMIQQVVENKTNIPSRPPAASGKKFDPTFWQVRGKANNGTSLVVGYKDNGPNKPRDILQAYPLGSTVNVVSHASRPTRSMRGRALSLLDAADVMNQIIDPYVNSQVQRIRNSPLFQAEVRKNTLHNTTLRALSLEFSDAENWPEAINSMSCDNQTEEIALSWSWKDQHTNIVNPKSFSLYKNCVFNQPCTSVQMENEAAFEVQPEKNALTDYFIRCVYGPNNAIQDSAAIRIGAETITDLKATINSHDKILLNWKFFDSKNINQNPSVSDLEGRAALVRQPSGFEKINWTAGKMQWKVFRNEESIDIEDGITSFEDDEVELNQVYVYRVMAFWEEEEAWHNQQHAVFYSKPLIVSTEQREDIGQDQFQFRTYLLKEDPYNFNKQSEEDKNDYISIHSFEDRQLCRDIVKKSTIIWDDKPVEMLNGLIDVEFNGRSLISPACFTNVRVLWDYLLALVEEYLEKEQATIYFPDQPILFSLKKKSQGMMEFQVGDKLVTIDEKRCLTAILQGAERFFTLLNIVSVDKDGVGEHYLLVTQIRDTQKDLRTQQLALDPTPYLRLERVAFNKVLLSWEPTRDAKSYKISLEGQEIIVLPAHKTSYIDIFQPKEQKERRIYELTAYDQDGTAFKTANFGIEIADSYLQIEKVTLPFALNWEFPEKDIPSIKYYEIFCDDVSVEVTENPTYTETIPAVGTSVYTIEALDSSKRPLEIQPIVMERSVSKLIKFIKLNWVFPEAVPPICRKYQLRRNGVSLGTEFQTTWIEKKPLAIGEYIYEVDALDYSPGKNEKIGSLQEQISIVQGDILNPTVPNSVAPAQAVSQVLVKRISANQIQLSWKPSVQNIERYEVLINNTVLIRLPGDQREYIHNMEQTGLPRNCIYTLTAYDQDDRKLEPYSMEFEVTSPFLLIKNNLNSRELSWGFSEQDMASIRSYNIFLNNTCIANGLPKSTTRYLHTSEVRVLRPGINTYRVEPVGEEDTCLVIKPAAAEVGLPYLTAKVTDGNIVELSWNFHEENGINIEQYLIFGKKCLDNEVLCTTNDIIELARTQRKTWKSSQELLPGRYTYFVKAEGTSLLEQYVVVEIK